ncbi:MAG: hypothetical protein V1843_04110 [bacterium]
MVMEIKIFRIMVPVLFLILLSSCTNTVVVKPTPGNQLTIAYNLAGELYSSYRYVIILNTNGDTIQAPSMNNGNIPFKLPSDTISAPYDRATYDTYFNTWTDYIVLESGQFKLYSGPMSGIDQNSTPDQIWIGPAVGSRISCSINTGFLGNSAPSVIGFKIVATTQSGDPLDEIRASENIINQVDQSKTGSDPIEGYDPSLEIGAWSALIQ